MTAPLRGLLVGADTEEIAALGHHRPTAPS